MQRKNGLSSSQKGGSDVIPLHCPTSPLHSDFIISGTQVEIHWPATSNPSESHLFESRRLVGVNGLAWGLAQAFRASPSSPPGLPCAREACSGLAVRFVRPRIRQLESTPLQNECASCCSAGQLSASSSDLLHLQRHGERERKRARFNKDGQIE